MAAAEVGRGIGRGSHGGLIGADNSEGESEEDDCFGKAEKIS